MGCARWPSQLRSKTYSAYLIQALKLPTGPSRVFEIGGPEPVSYGDIMCEYAKQRGLRRLMIPVPVLTPRLSSLWLGLVTPIYARVGRKLVDSLRNPTVVRDRSADEYFDIRACSLPEAIERAMKKEDREIAETKWSDAFSSSGKPKSWGGVRFGSRIVDSRSVVVPVHADRAFDPLNGLAARPGGITEIGFGMSVVFWTCWSGEWACVAAVVIPTTSKWAMLWISGGLNKSNQVTSSGCRRR